MINKGGKSKTLYIAPIDVESYAMLKIKSILKKLHIKGNVVWFRSKIVQNEEFKRINLIESKPLKEIIKPALKKSDNFVFDTLYITILASQKRSASITWDEGDQVIKNLAMQYFDVDFGEALFVDGSGLSRYNRLQPVKLLELLRRGFAVKEFVDAMPRPKEIESTMEKRDLDVDITAKTGNLSGISCLCGYKGSSKVFVIGTSGFSTPQSDILRSIDKLVNSNL